MEKKPTRHLTAIISVAIFALIILAAVFSKLGGKLTFKSDGEPQASPSPIARATPGPTASPVITQGQPSPTESPAATPIIIQQPPPDGQPPPVIIASPGATPTPATTPTPSAPVIPAQKRARERRLTAFDNRGPQLTEGEKAAMEALFGKREPERKEKITYADIDNDGYEDTIIIYSQGSDYPVMLAVVWDHGGSKVYYDEHTLDSNFRAEQIEVRGNLIIVRGWLGEDSRTFRLVFRDGRLEQLN